MNKRGLAHVRIGHAGAPQTHQKRSSCSTGGFYISPSQGQTVNSSSPFNITWDTSCLSNTQGVDIYLIAPSLISSRIHEWQNVNYALGNYQTSLETKWWNDTSTVNLQLSIVTSNTQPFLSPFPAGPVFTATYTAPSDGSTPASADLSSPDGVTYVGNFPSSSSSSGGKIAAGVLVPLIVIGLGIAVYFKLSRAKSKEKSRRFSEVIDKRMSTISVDWKSMSAAGASAAIRHSMAVSGGGYRNSSFSFGPIRPVSTAAAVEGVPSISDKASLDVPRMSQLRPGLRSQTTLGERVSRVSFATDIRPSIESRRTVGTSRAFHTGIVPPLPSNDDKEETGDLSPTQTKGPFTLTPDDIRARMSLSGASEARPSMDEVWPSLSMMRTGNEASGDDYLLPQEQQSVDMPLPPVPAHPAPESGLAMMPMPASVMSPDEMLRAYAERRMKSPPPSSLAFPVPAASYNGNGMRTLYTPSLCTEEGGEQNNRYTQVYDDPYAGTA
ncbi:hypothetical protein DFJ58DRAFT_723600 [Suillus subalutaceus]|uniref:uncharacterized protein n=1 Tax=Suillus subalutaceus TaxID=48586 RepID=UPI001B87F453|nr:uncharacterized protein DFJ58DRAFT_723600 [Suillus subalutaceus]KAG1868341.1 hypothetical protein DFJ58DRAFT_723600 [Suillus subalutaceus]